MKKLKALVIVIILAVSILAFVSTTNFLQPATTTSTENPFNHPIPVNGEFLGGGRFNYTYCGPECQAHNATTSAGSAVNLAASTSSSCTGSPMDCFIQNSATTCYFLGCATPTVTTTTCYYLGCHTTTTTTTSGHRPNATVALILAEFTDVHHNRTLLDIQDQWNSQVVDYYSKVSRGHYVPYADAFGWFNVNRQMAYYGSDSNGIIDSGIQGTQPFSWRLGVDALTQAENSGFNVTRYRTIFIIHAGDGQESDPTLKNNIWSVFYFQAPLIDNVGIVPETERTTLGAVKDPFGVWAHELGHGGPGFPDLYNPDENLHARTGHWELMSLGLWNGDGTTNHPYGSSPAYAAGILEYHAGWITGGQFMQITSGNVTVTLRALEQNTGIILIEVLSADHTQQYWVEARAQTGYDQFVPSGGILIGTVGHSGEPGSYRLINSHPADDTLNTGAWQVGMTFQSTLTLVHHWVIIRIVSYTAGVWTLNIEVV